MKYIYTDLSEEYYYIIYKCDLDIDVIIGDVIFFHFQ